jgi:hypothetical protein
MNNISAPVFLMRGKLNALLAVGVFSDSVDYNGFIWSKFFRGPNCQGRWEHKQKEIVNFRQSVDSIKSNHLNQSGVYASPVPVDPTDVNRSFRLFGQQCIGLWGFRENLLGNVPRPPTETLTNHTLV